MYCSFQYINENIHKERGAGLKQIRDISHRDGLEIEAGVTIDDEGLYWWYSEHMQFYEGDFFNEKQSFDDYLASGPPEYARWIDAARLCEIDEAVREIWWGRNRQR